MVQNIKQKVNKLPTLQLPLDSDYLVLECDGCEVRWGAILKRKKNKYLSKDNEQICRYASGKYTVKPQVYQTSTDYEVNAIIHALEAFKLFLINKPKIIIRIHCEAIVIWKKPNQQ